jgi:hypothetical protein
MEEQTLSAEEIFKRIQSSINSSAAQEDEDSDEYNYDYKLEDPQSEEDTKTNSSPSKMPSGQGTVHLRAGTAGKDGSTNPDPPGKKVYKFTEVSSGAKKERRRFSQCSEAIKLNAIPIHPPLLKTQVTSMYQPSCEKLKSAMNKIKKRNAKALKVMEHNQVFYSLFRKRSSNDSLWSTLCPRRYSKRPMKTVCAWVAGCQRRR